MKERFERSEALLGVEAMKRLAAAHVLVVGVGGVGSWCAEALVRTGLGHITLVDDDVVAESNLNRQCPATMATIGRPKVEAMRDRLLAINPNCEVIALRERFAQPVSNNQTVQTIKQFSLVIDAIDSVDCKAELILAATEAGIPIVSSMGAALRTDPTKVCVTRFEKVEGDGLARALRQRFKKLQHFPAAKFSCVWSTEVPNQTSGGCKISVPTREGRAPSRPRTGRSPSLPEFCNHLRINQPNNQTIPKGSLMTVTATFGMCLASEAISILRTALREPQRAQRTKPL